MLIRDASFVVTDTETTGTNPSAQRLIEIGAVRVEDGDLVDKFGQLINPHRSVPAFITRLTGISTAMVYDKPDITEVLPAFVDFLGDGVFVAHNRRFDERFINAELARMGRPPLRNRSLCTLRLARRSLPGLHSKSLSSLADFYGLRIQHRHRALDDAEATAFILLRLIQRIALEHRIDSVDELLAFQAKPYRLRQRTPKHLRRIRKGVLPGLPPTPGVYRMLNRAGETIYVGKAVNLRNRVRSYFTAIEAHPSKTRRLLQDVRDVKWRETGSELAALLLESRLIKRIQPKYNRALKRYGRRPFIKLDTSSPLPTVSYSFHLVDDGAEYFGPVRGARHAGVIVELINQMYALRECDAATLKRGRRCMYGDMGRCCMPCEGGEGYRKHDDEVQRVRRFLRGEDPDVLERLEREMRVAADRLDFEEAARYRDWLHKLDRTLSQQRSVATSVLDHNAVLIQPALEPDQYQLFFVRFGRLAHTMTVERKSNYQQRRRIERSVRSFFDPAQLRPARYSPAEVDEIRVLLNWLYVNRTTVNAVQWVTTDAPFKYAERVVDSLLRQGGHLQDAT